MGNPLTVNVQIVFCKHLWSIVDRLTRAVEYPPQHVFSTGSFMLLPVNSTWVAFTSTPDVPSKTCTIAFLPWTSSTWPPRFEPSGSVNCTISLYDGN